MTDTSKRDQPLAGLKVIDTATILAGPFAASVLAEFGATVIKVERPDGGDPMRRLGTDSDIDGSFWWLSDTRNKESVTLNLRTEEGSAGLKAMAAEADVLIENFRPGTMARWGIGYEDLKKVNPRLVVLSVTGFGQVGPMSSHAGVARVAEAFCGMSHLTGDPDGKPGLGGSSALADYVSGLYGAFGILLALEERRSSGLGQHVDVALYDGMARFLDELVPVYAAKGIVRERMGAETHRSVPHNNYRSSEGDWVTIACTNDEMFHRLAGAMGMKELVNDDLFATSLARIENRHLVNHTVAQWCSGLTSSEILLACTAASVPSGKVNDVADYVNSDHTAARDSIITKTVDGNDVVVPGVVPKLSETPGRVDRLGCTLGELDLTTALERLS